MNDISFKIGAHQIRVSYKDQEELDGYDDEGCCVRGMFNPDGINRDIWISRNIAGTNHTATLLHEVMEAINQIYELCLTHSQISQISEILTQIWVDNQKTIMDRLDL